VQGSWAYIEGSSIKRSDIKASAVINLSLLQICWEVCRTAKVNRKQKEKALSTNIDAQVGVEDVSDELWRTLIADELSLGDDEAHSAEDYHISIQYLRDIAHQDTPGAETDLKSSTKHFFERNERASHYYIKLVVCLKDRKFFATTRGYVGLGPDTLQPDDSVCVLRGARVPHVLRHVDCLGTECTWTFKGEAYVHGIMYNGKAEVAEDAEIVDEAFSLL
jgi:hypothetical protein